MNYEKMLQQTSTLGTYLKYLSAVTFHVSFIQMDFFNVLLSSTTVDTIEIFKKNKSTPPVICKTRKQALEFTEKEMKNPQKYIISIEEPFYW